MIVAPLLLHAEIAHQLPSMYFLTSSYLTNIDFDTLYKSEVIKADSVYCLNPEFNLDVEVGKKKGVKKAPPKLENIIQQLTGNLLLENVVVNNAILILQTTKDGVPSSLPSAIIILKCRDYG